MVASRSSMLSVGLIASTQAFTLQAPCAPTHGAVRSSSAVMEAEPLFSAETSRRAVLAALLGAGVGAGATPAFAGYVTNLGIETTNPKDADIDDEVLASKAVQDGLANIKKYKSAASSLKGMFDSDTAMNMIPTIRKEFDFSKVRDDLNVVSTVFDDTTQLTVDRVARGILYDLTELENASRLKKEETSRTPKKIATVEKWFEKLDGDFSTLLKYFPA